MQGQARSMGSSCSKKHEPKVSDLIRILLMGGFWPAKASLSLVRKLLLLLLPLLLLLLLFGEYVSTGRQVR